MMTNLLNGAHVANKLFSTIARLRLLLVMFVALTISAEVWGEEVIFTFNTKEGIQELGLTAPASSNGTDLTANQAYAKGSVSLSATHGSTTKTRVWNSSGSYDLRVYTDGSLTFSVPTGSNITKIVSTGTATNISVNTGTFNNGTWTGKANSVTYTANGNLKMKTFTITYEVAATCNTAPIVSAGGNSTVTTNSATVTCSGGITSLGSAGCSITSYGFVYSTSSNPTISDTKVQVGTSYTTTGTSFNKSITGLSANTTYYVRPYATNGYGTAYGTQTSFKTKEIKYTVTYNANGATGTVPTDANEYASGATVTVMSHGDLAKIGYSFTGWSDGTNTYQPGANYTMPAKNVTFTAQWQINTYKVKWNVDGSETEVDVNYNSKPTGAPTIDPNDLPCEGADKFVGWTIGEYKGNSAPGTLYPTANDIPAITDNITFYAVFADYAD